MTNIIFVIYILLNILATYQTIWKEKILIFVQIFSIGYFMFFLNQIAKEKKINKYVFFMLMALTISFLFNMKEYIKYMFNAINICTCFYLANKNKTKTKLILKIILVITIINFFLILALPKTSLEPKIFFGIVIPRLSIDYLGLAVISINAGITAIYAVSIDNKLLKYFMLGITIVILMVFSKISVLLGLILAITITKFHLKLSRKGRIIVNNMILLLFFLGNYIFILNSKVIEKVVRLKKILTGREQLWEDYISYILTKGNIWSGNGFFEQNKKISYLLHPHNSYISLIYILGIFGGIVYYLYFSKILKSRSLNLNKENSVYFTIILFILFLMNADDYFILTIYPIYLIIFMEGLE